MIDVDYLLDLIDKAICCLEPKEVKDNPFYLIVYDIADGTN